MRLRESVVVIRRQWNSFLCATVRVADLSGLHFSQFSGGVHAPARREFLHGYIWCDQLQEGELAHLWLHGPHESDISGSFWRKHRSGSLPLD